MIKRSKIFWIIITFIMVYNISHHAVDSLADTTDPRFMGTYCAKRITYTQKVKYKVKFLGITIYSGTKNVVMNIDNIKANANYREDKIERKIVGIVEGQGSAQINGQDITFAFGGIVKAKGILKGAVRIGLQGYSTLASTVYLSSDGLAITLYYGGNSYTIRKDECGNNFPVVTIESPNNGASLEFGKSYVFNGTVIDEDVIFPPERMVWKSSRDGILGGYSTFGPMRASLFPNYLSPGTHTITFSATDNGGLVGSTNIKINVINQPPDKPTIFKPKVSDQIFATVNTVFLGQAYDFEEGLLKGLNLIWSSDIDGMIGYGTLVNNTLITPGVHNIRLTAKDKLGATSFTEYKINVLPYTDNSAPQVTIIKPEYYSYKAIAVLAGKEITFVGTVSDKEDPIGDLSLTWSVSLLGSTFGNIFGTNSTKATTTLTAINGSASTYKIIFSAKDKSGMTGMDSIIIYVLPKAIQ